MDTWSTKNKFVSICVFFLVSEIFEVMYLRPIYQVGICRNALSTEMEQPKLTKFSLDLRLPRVVYDLVPQGGF